MLHSYYVHTIHFNRVSPRGFLIGRLPPKLISLLFSAPCRFNELSLKKGANVRSEQKKKEKEIDTHGLFLKTITEEQKVTCEEGKK